MKADDVPLCGNGIFELLDASNGFPAPPQKRDHVAVVANVGDRISVRIFENDTCRSEKVGGVGIV
ncbi:hypothetical protein NECAME_10799 [Necator americanus]|uniref:Uncharacterized protein n=1 Tax=Necator americanus TaxID=51031 RepID=W2T867_NECAM|nr:hypothetical protein NECAME_10799 [Necator americanus]ETN77789.1 hypothetical protein NECAME_10799 [Necator americanus]